MDVLTEIGPGGWGQLLVALVALAGPGLALSRLTQVRRPLDATQALAVALPLGMALWAVLLAWAHLVSLRLGAPALWAVAVLGWASYGWSLWHERRRPGWQPVPRREGWPVTTALWLIVAATAAVSVAALRGVVVQPGSDGYHHTLIAQTIANRGGLPDDLLPLTSLASFRYHYGFHAFVAALNWLTGISVVALTPVAAQLLKAVAALSVAFLVEALGGRRIGAVVAACVAGLAAVFPAYYVNWGRNPQLAGLGLLAVLLGLVWLWSEAKPAGRTTVLIALLAAGTGLTHYRVTIMGAIGCALIVLAVGWREQWHRGEWLRRLAAATGMVALALLLVLPWLWHVVQVGNTGYPAPIARVAAGFFQLDRLGALVLNYPTNWPVILLTGAALAWGLWRRSLGVAVLAAWAALLYLLSQPFAAGERMDTITVVQSLFVPAAGIIGLAASDFVMTWGTTRRWPLWAIGTVTAALALAGGYGILHIVESGAPYVLPEDLPAAAWVRANTPEDALFMVNTYRFPVMPDYVIGNDAGGWLPVLAGRRAVTAPMIFNAERNTYPDYPQRIVALADLGGDLTSPAALALLRADGITHVFVGKRGGPIAVETLKASPDYHLEYEQDGVLVFRLLPAPGG